MVLHSSGVLDVFSRIRAWGEGITHMCLSLGVWRKKGRRRACQHIMTVWNVVCIYGYRTGLAYDRLGLGRAIHDVHDWTAISSHNA